MRYLVSLAALASFAVAACGTSGTGGGKADPARYGSPASGDPIKGTLAYDEHGKSVSCAPPETHCSDDEPSVDFQDDCKLKGYRLIRCGCDTLCTGNVSTPKQAYTSKNVAKACAQAKDDCSPPETSAEFQDACTDAGHKFVVCGCEWLCDGKMRGPVADVKPPPEDEEPAGDEGGKDAKDKKDKNGKSDKKEKAAPKKK